MKLEQGVIYYAAGERWLKEAVVSARSLRKVMPDIPVLLFTDQEYQPDRLFTGVEKVNNFVQGTQAVKIEAFRRSPFVRSVFIDTDTYICRAFPEVFTLLDRFQIAAPRDHWSQEGRSEPSCFDDFNTGFVAFRNDPEVKESFEKWQAQALAGTVSNDQPAFRDVMYQSSLSLYVLPQNYNVRLIYSTMLGIKYTPVILHGRCPDYEKLKQDLSLTDGCRVFLPSIAAWLGLGKCAMPGWQGNFLRMLFKLTDLACMAIRLPVLLKRK